MHAQQLLAVGCDTVHVPRWPAQVSWPPVLAMGGVGWRCAGWRVALAAPFCVPPLHDALLLCSGLRGARPPPGRHWRHSSGGARGHAADDGGLGTGVVGLDLPAEVPRPVYVLPACTHAVTRLTIHPQARCRPVPSIRPLPECPRRPWQGAHPQARSCTTRARKPPRLERNPSILGGAWAHGCVHVQPEQPHLRTEASRPIVCGAHLPILVPRVS